MYTYVYIGLTHVDLYIAEANTILWSSFPSIKNLCLGEKMIMYEMFRIVLVCNEN